MTDHVPDTHDSTPATGPLALKSNEGLGPLLDSEEDPARLWAEIHRLRAALAGPAGYASWKDAAADERHRRMMAERREQQQLEPLRTELRAANERYMQLLKMVVDAKSMQVPPMYLVAAPEGPNA